MDERTKGLIDAIIKAAEEELFMDDDDFNPMDYSGSNYDDAFDMGCREGRVLFARYLRSKYDL